MDQTAHNLSDAVAGTVKVLPQIWSPERQNARDIYVYLPPSHETTDRRFPVVYMQDGQNLFDDALAFGAEWQVDENMERLSQLGVEAIVVGIPNVGAARCDEYSPFRDAWRMRDGCTSYCSRKATGLARRSCTWRTMAPDTLKRRGRVESARHSIT